MKNKWYVTTPIYYVTAKPHLGSLYSTLLADVIARWKKLQGRDVFFLTGTDEHGQKVAQAAQAAQKEIPLFLAEFIPAYKDTWRLYDIDYSYFVRTTDKAHIKGVQSFIEQLMANNALYVDTYAGWYCTPCETFVTEKEASKQVAPHCPSCSRETHLVEEETFFFKLSAYQDQLLSFYKENPDFIVPKERFNEVISFVQAGLKDLSISRRTVKWGVPFPRSPEQVVYVWVDALCNYLTGIGYGDVAKQKEFAQWWPADVQVMAKDIVRFHAIYWPALLMAAGLQLPKQLLVHGWIKVDHRKMSKSFGNVIDPVDLAQTYGSEPVRYYLVRQLAITQDADFSIADLEQRINSDLANDLGNLLQRMVALAEKQGIVSLTHPKTWSERALRLRDDAWTMIEEFETLMDEYSFHMALGSLWQFINKVNAYFHETEPWKLAKTDGEGFKEVLSATAHSLRIIAILLWPVMPKKMEALLMSIGQRLPIDGNTIERLELGSWSQSFTLHKVAPLFAKIEPKEAVIPEEKTEEKQLFITIDDLIKVDLRVGTIIDCQAMPKSDKLLQMKVDLGELGQRQILAGIAQSYTPEQLIGKQGTFVVNLQPRKMMGTESQGMMLIAKDADGKVKIMQPQAPVPNGSKLQ